jgi:hypothetical protein
MNKIGTYRRLSGEVALTMGSAAPCSLTIERYTLTPPPPVLNLAEGATFEGRWPAGGAWDVNAFVLGSGSEIEQHLLGDGAGVLGASPTRRSGLLWGPSGRLPVPRRKRRRRYRRSALWARFGFRRTSVPRAGWRGGGRRRLWGRA